MLLYRGFSSVKCTVFADMCICMYDGDHLIDKLNEYQTFETVSCLLLQPLVLKIYKLIYKNLATIQVSPYG